MIKTPKISIIIACFNDPDIVKAVKSACLQTYTNKEIIVVDDGSNLETKNAIKTVEKEIDILLTQKNNGQSIARNNGIKKASGDYILNWDSDDFFEPSFCEKAIKVFTNNTEVKIVTCRARRFTKKGLIDEYSPKGGAVNDFLYSNSALGSSMFIKKDWLKCGGYDEKLPILGFEDWEFFIRILKNGGYAHVIKETLFNYQIREGSTTQRIKLNKHEKFKLILLKHKNIYLNEYETLIENLFYRINKVETEKHKRIQGLEYKLGKTILTPLRAFRSILKKK